jgi:hypothetical protein
MIRLPLNSCLYTDLDQFVYEQRQIQNLLHSKLNDLSTTVLSNVRAAADEVVDTFLKV